MISYILIVIFSVLLSSIYLYFNKSRNETVFIWFLTFIIFLIVKTLLQIEISVWMWIGLFAVLSLLSFRKTFSITTLKYFLIAISLWIINAFWTYESYLISGIILITIFLIEKFFLFKKVIKLKLKINIKDFNQNLSEENIRKIIFENYWVFFIKQITIEQDFIIIKWIK